MKDGRAAAAVCPPRAEDSALGTTAPTRGGRHAVSRHRLGDAARRMVRAQRERRASPGDDLRRRGRARPARTGRSRLHRDDERRRLGARAARGLRLDDPARGGAQGEGDRAARLQDRPRRRRGARRAGPPRSRSRRRLLMTIPGVAELLGLTLASEIGDISRFPSARKLVGYSGLTPRIKQSGQSERVGRLSKAGPDTLRWAAVEAAQQAWRPSNPWHPLYTDIKRRHGKANPP